MRRNLLTQSALSRMISGALALLLTIQSGALAAAAPTPAVDTAAPTPAVGVKEPLIEVSVDSLEISETNDENLGLLWGSSVTGSDGKPSFVQGRLQAFEHTVPSIINFGKLDRVAIETHLDLLIRNNQARILANPTLLTKSGFEANFLVGGEIPYPTVGQGGVGGVEFKKYGVSLKILPQITPRKTIEAQINVGVSNPDSSVAILSNGQSVPGLASREAGSKVEVNDGETVVLAGIKQSVRSKEVVRVPVLGYIPLLGLLFRHKQETVRQISLVLFVTFRFVKDRQVTPPTP